MSSMRQVYQLNDSGDEDYLSMESSVAAVPDVAQPAASVRQSKPAAAKTIRRTPTSVATIARARAVTRDIYASASNQPRIDDDDNVDNDDDVKPGKGKKIAFKSVQEHQQLINQLNAFSCSTRFSPVLKECGIVIKDLRLKSVSELRELRERVRACCASSGSRGGIVSTGILGACGQMEAWAPPRLMCLDGYRTAVESNPEFASLCEMIEIDSGFLTSMSPMQKMVMCLGTTAMSVAAINKTKGEAAHATATLVNNLRLQQQQQQNAAKSGSPAEAAPLPSVIVPVKAVLPQKLADDVRSY